MFAKIISVGLFGMEAYMTGVEADISGGMPRFDVVGLPDTAVSESRERVRSAIKNNGGHKKRGADLRPAHSYSNT